ncbi:MAG TPA: NUDIX hydrolase [Patescibacteria group bacterium]|jgi:8-oxo-dGTP diphosphatase|nr:NUDIX hydrolase [Patescibacteria group bacterium]
MARTKSVGVLIIKDGKVLLVKHGQAARHLNGRYGFPAGRIADSEDERTAAARELLEETGLKTQAEDLKEFPGNYVESTLEMKHGPEDFAFRVFLAESFAGELKNSDETEPEWIEIDKLGHINALANIRDITLKGWEFIKRKQ